MNVKLTSTNFAAENLIHNGPKFSERPVETKNCSTGKFRGENIGTTDNLSLCSRNSTSSTSGSECPQTGAGRGFQKDLIPRHHASPSEHTAISREQEDIPRSSSPINHIEAVPDLPFGKNQSTPVPQKCSPISLSLWSPKWDRRSTLADQPEPQQPIMHPSSSPVLGIPTSNISALSLAYSSLMHAQTLNGAVQRATPHVVPPSSISNLRHPSVSSLTPPTSMTDYLDNLARTRHQSFGKNNVNPSQSHFNSLLNNLFSGNMESWHQLQRVAQSSNADPRLLGLYNGSGYPFEIPGTGRRKNATRETTSMLKAWLNEHRKNPYPTKGEKIMLAIVTKMSLTQVSTWFANARRRLKKENKMTWHSRCSSSIQDVDDDSNEDGPIDDDEEDDTLPRKNLPEGHLLERFLDTGDIQRLAASNLESQQQALFNAEFWKLNHQRLDRDQRKRSPSDGSEIHNRKQRKIWSVADLSQEHKPEMDKESLNENPSLNEYRVQPLSSGVELRRAPEIPDKLNENYTMIEAQLRSMTSNLPSIRTDLNGFNPSSMISPAALAAFYLYYQQRQRQARQEFSAEELLSNVRNDSLQTLHSATLRESKPEY